MRRSGTFFWVTTQTLSFPRTATEVSPSLKAALKAYSIWYSRPCVGLMEWPSVGHIVHLPSVESAET